MNHRKKQDTDGTTYFVAFNPLTAKIAVGELTKGLQVETGQAILFTSPTKKTAYDMAFSEWSEDDDGNVSGTPREYEFSEYPEGDTELEEVLAQINGAAGFHMKSIKHPRSDKRLLAFSEHSFGKLPKTRRAKLAGKKQLRDGSRVKRLDLR